MVERRIRIEALQKEFSVGIKDAVRKKRNRSFANATDCCGSAVKQRKMCSVCDGDVTGAKFARKIVKIGKAEHLINAQALQQVRDSVKENDTIKVHTIMRELPAGISDRHDSYSFAVESKKAGDFAELRELFRSYYGIGTASFGTNEYEVVIWTGTDDRVRINRLVEQSQFYDKPSTDTTGKFNEQIVEAELQIMDKACVDEYNFTQFRDTRAEAEEQMIEDVVIHGKTPEVPTTIEKVEEKNDQEELERLKALMS